MLLCDVFERFIDMCLNYYQLDPCHYFSSPGLSWDAMLKMTEVKLELISDVDMHLFIEKGMRGGNTLLKDTVKLMKKNLLCIGMQIIYMVGQ